MTMAVMLIVTRICTVPCFRLQYDLLTMINRLVVTRNGTMYQKNSNGSSVFDNGQGFLQYTSAEGEKTNARY